MLAKCLLNPLTWSVAVFHLAHWPFLVRKAAYSGNSPCRLRWTISRPQTQTSASLLLDVGWWSWPWPIFWQHPQEQQSHPYQGHSTRASIPFWWCDWRSSWSNPSCFSEQFVFLDHQLPTAHLPEGLPSPAESWLELSVTWKQIKKVLDKWLLNAC